MIFWALIFYCHASSQDYIPATNKAFQALYTQTGLESYVNVTAKDLDKKYVPDYINSNGIIILLLYKITIEHRVEWKWTFP